MNEQCGIYRVIDILNMYNIQGDTKGNKIAACRDY